MGEQALPICGAAMAREGREVELEVESNYCLEGSGFAGALLPFLATADDIPLAVQYKHGTSVKGSDVCIINLNIDSRY